MSGPPESPIRESADGAQVDDAPPSTGIPTVDDALAPLAELAGRAVSEHHEALAVAHEALHRELQSPSPSP